MACLIAAGVFMAMFSLQAVVEKIKTHILCSVAVLFVKNRAVYEIEVQKYCRAGQATDDNMAHACWICKVTNTHSEYVILIDFSTATVVTRRHLNVML